MKRFLLVVFFIFSLCLCFASDYTICIYPENNDLFEIISRYFDADIVSSSVNCNTDLLITGDDRLLEYICNKSKSDLLLIPIVEKISNYNYLRLYSYTKESHEFVLEFQSINIDASYFDYESIKKLYNRYLERNSGIINTSELSYIEEVSHNVVLLDCSNAVADIFLNGKYLGQTPHTLDTYPVPSVIKFCAKGFADRSYSLSENSPGEIMVTLIPDFKSDSSEYTKKQNKYLASFAAAVLGWGSKIIVSAVNPANQTLNKVLNIASWGLALSSSGYLAYNIFDYFKTTQNTTP